MKAFFNQLFDYNFLCNKKLIEQIEKLDTPPDEAVRLFSHILNAHHIWNHRLLGQSKQYEVWQIHGVDAWHDIHYENQRATFEVIRNKEDSEDYFQRVDYETTEGRVFANDIGDILFHIINQSTHHRGQVVANLRSYGIAPEQLDFILYKR